MHSAAQLVSIAIQAFCQPLIACVHAPVSDAIRANDDAADSQVHSLPVFIAIIYTCLSACVHADANTHDISASMT